MSFPCSAVLATIPAGQSLSGKAYVGHGELVSLVIPASWTSAVVTFRGSLDGETFYDIHDYLGAEVSIAASASRMFAIDNFSGATWIKARSGTSGSPVVQTDDAVLSFGIQKLPVP